MQNPGPGQDPALDWIESYGAKAWARSELSLEPIPGFRSSARRKLQQSIADDETEIMQLEDSIRNLRHRIGMNRARLAPIRLIPNETLSAIFLEWLHLRDLSKTAEIEYFLPPVAIMAVCRHWAACATSTPAIWSHGTYRINTSEIATFDHARLLKTFFDRAGSSNLKVHFDGSDKHYPADNVWCKIMEPSLFRMEDLTISRAPMDLEGDLGPLYEWPDRKMITSLTTCIRLSQLTLCNIGFPESERQVPIVLTTVRTIQFDSCDGNPPIQSPVLVALELIECSLSHCYALSLSTSSPMLEKVQLFMNYWGRGKIVSRPAFLCLRHLEIGSHDDLSIPRLFCKTPNLSELELSLVEDSFREEIEVRPLSSYPALTSLSLSVTCSMCRLDDEGMQVVQEWMVQARNLAELRLNFERDGIPYEDVCGMERFIEPLLTTGRDFPYFPHLKHITIEGEQRLEETLLQLLVDRASNAERAEDGFPPCGMATGIIQRPCLLTLVHSCTLPNMESVGLKEFLDNLRMQESCGAVRKEDNVE